MELLEGMVESGRLALGEVEGGLANREDGRPPDIQVVVESVVRGYGTFLREMARTARHLADHYRSESGRLTAKPQSRVPSPSGATPREGEGRPVAGGS